MEVILALVENLSAVLVQQAATIKHVIGNDIRGDIFGHIKRNMKAYFRHISTKRSFILMKDITETEDALLYP
jgi:hypothetical protein